MPDTEKRVSGMKVPYGMGSVAAVFQGTAKKGKTSVNVLGFLLGKAAQNLGELIHGGVLQLLALALELWGGRNIDDTAVGVGPGALHQPQLLQAVYHTGDGAVGTAGSLGQLTDGHRAVAVQNGQYNGLGISQVEFSVVKTELFRKTAANL